MVGSALSKTHFNRPTLARALMHTWLLGSNTILPVALALFHKVECRAVGVWASWSPRRWHAVPVVDEIFRRCDALKYRIRCTGPVAADHENAAASVRVLN